MRLKPRPLEIGEKTGFTENDRFWRKDFAGRLTNLVKNIEDSTVFLLDGEWGSGKTTFLKQWAGELRTAGIPVIEFDAFARDYQNDPFIALSAEIFAAAKKVDSLEESTCADFIERAKSLGKATLSIIAQVAISKISSGEVSLDDVKKLGEAPKDDLSEIIEERLISAEADAELLTSFREALKRLAKGMSAEGGMPLVLIVDELDRCRPSFAVELIEKVKHVFSVHGVHFVLSAHLSQLTKIFQNTYGLGGKEQALTYLEKFYDVRLRFSASSMLTGTVTREYITYLWGQNQLNLVPKDPDKCMVFLDSLECIFQNREVSLRTVEKIMTNIALYYAGASSGGGNSVFVSGICIIRHFDPELYGKIASSNATWDEINKFFGFDSWPQERTSSLYANWWRFLFDRPDGELAKTNLDQSAMRAVKGMSNDLLPKITAQVDNFYPSGP